MNEKERDERCSPEESCSETGKKKQIKKRERRETEGERGGRQRVRLVLAAVQLTWWLLHRQYNDRPLSFSITSFLSGCQWIQQKFFRIPKLKS